ncbi:MAG: hypothetical protein WCL50_12805 [Spirochaetota bacterium]
MSRSFAVIALFAIAFLPLSAQNVPVTPGAPVESGEQGTLSSSPYKSGDHSISLSAGGMIPLAIIPFAGAATSQLHIGAGFGFSYRYFLDRQWAVGGSVSGAFNGTLAGRSLFIAPLSADISYWKAFVPFEFFLEGGVGGFLSRLDTNGMIGPFAKVGGAALWRTGSGWSVGIKSDVWLVPEIHVAPYADLTRTGLLLDAGLFAVYHL